MRALFFVFLLTWAGWADPQVERIFAQARRVNPTLADYSASLDVEMDTRLGPLHDRPRLKGQYFFKQEDKHQIRLEKAPSYLQRHARFFGFSLPRLERYNSRVMEETAQTWKIELIPKVKDPNTNRVELMVDKQSYTVPGFETFYNEDGHLSIAMKYVRTQGFTVLESAVADLRLPSLMLTSHAEIRYGNYAFNVGLTDELFQGKKAR